MAQQCQPVADVGEKRGDGALEEEKRTGFSGFSGELMSGWVIH
jgi:hypothetical protein